MKDLVKGQVAELERLYKEQDNIYRNAALQAGISDAMHWVLYAICESSEPVSQNKLAEEWFYPKQTINSAVQKLIRQGFVELVTVQGKRNEKTTSLTSEGIKFCKRYIYPLIEAEKGAFLQLSKEERMTFLRIFRRQNDYLRERVQNL